MASVRYAEQIPNLDKVSGARIKTTDAPVVFIASGVVLLISKGGVSGAKFKSSFSRLRWNKPCNTITTDNQSVGGMINLHLGRPLTDGTYSDSRPLSILELIRVTGLPDDFFIPTWASNADSFIREVIGECFAPLHVKALLSTLPVFANDNTASEETTVEAEEKTSEVEKKEIAE